MLSHVIETFNEQTFTFRPIIIMLKLHYMLSHVIETFNEQTFNFRPGPIMLNLHYMPSHACHRNI